MTTRHAFIATSIGDLLLVAEDEALTGLYFEHHRYPPAPDTIGERIDIADDPVMRSAAGEVREYLAGERREFTVPLALHGDAFSEQVWRRLLTIPYGETSNYGSLAKEIGNLALAQRVGQAVGHNPISIIVPCHRVLGSDGSLTGYAGGLDRKRWLLRLEEPPAAAAGRLF